MQILITFLTVLLVLNCLFLMLLVLIQLPKKEAGAGLAFGGGATDALFGAGSGNALTKLTKYASGTFLTLALILGVMNARIYHSGESDVRRALATSKPSATTPAPAAPAKPASQFTPLTQTGTNLMSSAPVAATTNAAATAAASTNVLRPIATVTNTPATK